MLRRSVQVTHGLGLPGDAGAGAGDFVQALGLDQREGHLPVQQGVLGQVDLLLAALTQKALHLVAAVGERGGCRRSSAVIEGGVLRIIVAPPTRLSAALR